VNKKVDALKIKILEAHKNEDIASLYVLEQEVHEVLDEDMINAYYTNILDLALEKLTNMLEAHIRMDMKNVQDFATIRALYEYAIEHYSAGKSKDASALFEVLSGLSNDEKFSKSLTIHTIASSENLPFNNFLENIADIPATQDAGTFYISQFQNKAQELLDNSKS
jgi:hypothetical protein